MVPEAEDARKIAGLVNKAIGWTAIWRAGLRRWTWIRRKGWHRR